MENIQKPKNNLALTIVGTVLFWPISLWGLLKAVKVNSLWESGNHQEAIDASNSARKLGIAGIIVGGIFFVIGFIAQIAILSAAEDVLYGDYYDDYYYDDDYDYYY
jgi:hypothetical protein